MSKFRSTKGPSRPTGPQVEEQATVPSFLTHLARATFADPVEVTESLSLSAPRETLGKPAGLVHAALRQVLHRPHRPAGSDAGDGAAAPMRVVHLEAVEAAGALPTVAPGGLAQTTATATLTAARVTCGLAVGVAEPSPLPDCLRVRLPAVEGARGELLVTARCPPAEPVLSGEAVIVVVEPNAIFCLAINTRSEQGGTFVVDAAGPRRLLEAQHKAAADGKAGSKRRRADEEGDDRVYVRFRPEKTQEEAA